MAGVVALLLAVAVMKPWAGGPETTAAPAAAPSSPPATPVADQTPSPEALGSSARASPPPAATPPVAAGAPMRAPTRYRVGEPFLLHHQITLVLPEPRDGGAGWTVSGRFVVKHLGQRGEVGLGAWTVGAIYLDPCHWQESPVVPIGAAAASERLSWVDQIVGGLMRQQGRQAWIARPDDPPSGPWYAPALELSVSTGLDLATCDGGQYRVWSGRTDATGGDPEANANEVPGQVDDIYILELDRGPVVFDAWHLPAASGDDLDELDTILRSIRAP